MYIILIFTIITIYTIVIYFLSLADDPAANITIIILGFFCCVLLMLNCDHYYSNHEYQKPMERRIIKYDENNIPIDTVYIHPNL